MTNDEPVSHSVSDVNHAEKRKLFALIQAEIADLSPRYAKALLDIPEGRLQSLQASEVDFFSVRSLLNLYAILPDTPLGMEPLASNLHLIRQETFQHKLTHLRRVAALSDESLAELWSIRPWEARRIAERGEIPGDCSHGWVGLISALQARIWGEMGDAVNSASDKAKKPRHDDVRVRIHYPAKEIRLTQFTLEHLDVKRMINVVTEIVLMVNDKTYPMTARLKFKYNGREWEDITEYPPTNVRLNTPFNYDPPPFFGPEEVNLEALVALATALLDVRRVVTDAELTAEYNTAVEAEVERQRAEATKITDRINTALDRRIQ